MRATDKCDDDITLRSFLQNDLRVTRRNDLGTLLGGDLGNEIVNIPLAQDLQMGIRLIKK